MSDRYSWQESYEAAILETDLSRLPTKIVGAHTAIATRMKELAADHGGTPDEWQALMDAVLGLKILDREMSPD